MIKDNRLDPLPFVIDDGVLYPGVSKYLLPNANKIFVVMRIRGICVGFNKTTKNVNSFGISDAHFFSRVLKIRKGRGIISSI